MENKGFTLVELIISIALISIVVMFLFNLLTDVKASNNNTDFNRKNQQKRAIIIKNIQEDLTNRKLVGILNRHSNELSSNTIANITFQFQDGDTFLKIVNDGDNQSISYTNHSGTEKWNLEKQSQTTHFNTTCIKYSNSLFSTDLDNGEYFYVKINIPIVVNKNKVNNIDDIELFYIGLKKDLTQQQKENFKDMNYTKLISYAGLGYYQENTCEKNPVN